MHHNLIIEDFLSNLEMPEIIKLLALKNVKFSNSAIEAVNKIIKWYLRIKLPDTLEKLIECLEEVIQNYNSIRPHGSTSSPLAVHFWDLLQSNVILLKK